MPIRTLFAYSIAERFKIGNAERALQQQVARQVVALLHARGFDHVVQEWHGQIEQALAWTFT